MTTVTLEGETSILTDLASVPITLAAIPSEKKSLLGNPAKNSSTQKWIAQAKKV
jgi:hypothetical protein